MTRHLSFWVEGQPLPKARPRIVNGRASTPQRTKDWEGLIRWTSLAKFMGQDVITEPVSVKLVFHRKDNVKADIDNLTKSVLDALNNVVYEDDRQVRVLNAMVFYQRENPGVSITIQTLSASELEQMRIDDEKRWQEWLDELEDMSRSELIDMIELYIGENT